MWVFISLNQSQAGDAITNNSEARRKLRTACATQIRFHTQYCQTFFWPANCNDRLIECCIVFHSRSVRYCQGLC